MNHGSISLNSDSNMIWDQDQGGETPTGKTKQSLSTPSASGHKRSISGNILSFPFFGGNPNRHELAPKSPIRTKPTAEGLPPSPRSAKGAMASVMQQTKTRTRKGSLRKAALLGGKARLENNDAHGSSSSQENPPHPAHLIDRSDTSTPKPYISPTPISPIPPEVPSHTKPTFTTSSHVSPPGPAYHLLLEATKPTTVPFPSIPPPTSASTTDEDDLSFPALKPPPAASPSSSLSSYFPPQPPHLRPRAQKSPLASLPSTLPPSPLPPLLPHDYSETRAWGWVLLFTTWIVVVVGMGSCFGVWSWAWDVGETPYAPPELEDDPTLPIVGYYPALIILTGIMAWVWVVVAWMGMKYFRHAKMGGEDDG